MPPIARGKNVNFCFEAKSWNKVINNSIELTKVFSLHLFYFIKRIINNSKVFRQVDPNFVAMLNEIRHGIVKPETIAALKATANNILLYLRTNITIIFDCNLDPLQMQTEDGHQILPTRLEPYRDDGI